MQRMDMRRTWKGVVPALMPVLLFALVTGCTRDPSPSTGQIGNDLEQSKAARVAPAIPQRLAASLASARAGSAQRASTTGTSVALADLPDHGELSEALPQAPVQKGAYRWHAVRLSEAHALASLATGIMKLRAPNGELMTLRYDRHEEHASGDWTWIGHVDGVPGPAGEVVLTFGAQAAFGTIHQPDPTLPPLKLDMRDGVAWMGETTYDALSRDPPRQPHDDALVVPGMASTTASASDLATIGVEELPVHAWTAEAPIVDVMAGYTAGYRDAVGSTSATVTRLNFLIDVMNAALASAKVPGRMRLVHTQYVTFKEVDIYKALEQLAGTNGVSVPASLRPLNGVLRDRYGADLVMLMTGNVDSQGGACGLGYQPGTRGATPPINPATDSAIGFSVIVKACDDAVRHELGHNLGLNHDQVTSDGSTRGPFPYSFGYKTSGPDGIGFHDVMAYGDPGQPVYNYYANPRIKIKGIPAGTAAVSDAARSLTETMQYTAQYRETKVLDGYRVRNDVNGDGKSDLMFRNFNAHVFSFWGMNGANIVALPPPRATPLNGHMLTSGDFNGDGKSDLVWMDGSRRLWLWRSNGSGWGAHKLQTAGLTIASSIVGAADLNGDGKDELLVVTPGANTFSYWRLNATTVTRGRTYRLASGARLVSTGDFNGDGKQDLVWMSSSRQLYLWWSNGGGLDDLDLAYALIDKPLGAGWDVVGAGDINGDGKSDLMFYRPSGTDFIYWLMNRNLVTWRSPYRKVGGNATFAATGDFDGNGRTDIVWRSGATLYMWRSNGSLPGSFGTINRSLSGYWHVADGGVGGR